MVLNLCHNDIPEYWSYAFILLQSKCPSFMRLTHYASSKSAEMAVLQANSLLKLRFSPFVYTDLDAVCNSSSSIAAIKIALCKANIYRSACMPEWGQRIPTPEAYMSLTHISTLKKKLCYAFFSCFHLILCEIIGFQNFIYPVFLINHCSFLISSASRASFCWSI